MIMVDEASSIPLMPLRFSIKSERPLKLNNLTFCSWGTGKIKKVEIEEFLWRL